MLEENTVPTPEDEIVPATEGETTENSVENTNEEEENDAPVSYTHLTLPTICSV